MFEGFEWVEKASKEFFQVRLAFLVSPRLKTNNMTITSKTLSAINRVRKIVFLFIMFLKLMNHFTKKTTGGILS
jgi:hypothetical protein